MNFSLGFISTARKRSDTSGLVKSKREWAKLLKMSYFELQRDIYIDYLYSN